MSQILTLDLLRAERVLESVSLDGAILYRARVGEEAWTDLRFSGSPALVEQLAAWTAGRAAPALPGLFLQALGPWGEAIRKRLRASARPQLALRLGAQELHTLPWELLPLGPEGEPLGLCADLRVCWPDTHTSAWAQGPQEQVRVLVACSDAGGPVPQEQHLAAWSKAWQDEGLPWDPSTDALTALSLASLRAALEGAQTSGRPYGTLHLLCHGGPLAGGTGLHLHESREPVSGEALAAVLAPYAKDLRLVVLAACRGADAGGGALGSVAGALHRAGLAAVIACRRPFSIPGSNQFTQVLASCIAQTQGCNRALARTRQALLQQHPEDCTALTLLARPEDGYDLHSVDLCPYPGLGPLAASRALRFFPWERERQAALAALETMVAQGRPRLLLLTGPSGVGKSAVATVGLGRALAQRSPAWETAVIRPGADPEGALDAALAARKPGAPLLLVVDPLEELFTQSPEPRRQPFVQRLWALCSGAEVWVVASLRSDFAGRCAELLLSPQGPRLDHIAEGLGDWAQHRLPLVELSPEALREAILLPAQGAGLTLTPGLAELLLSETAGEPGALPLLVYSLTRLWARRRGRRLVLEDFEAMGGVKGALSSSAEELWTQLDPAAQAQARRLLLSLVDMSAAATGAVLDARRRVPLDPLRPSSPPQLAAFERALAAFAERHLLVLRKSPDTVELSHEALLRVWPRFGTWIAEDRERLFRVAEVESWIAEAPDPQLLRGPRLTLALEAQAKGGELLSPQAHAVIAAASASRRARLRNRRLRRGAMGLLTLGALAASAVSLWYLDGALEAQQHTQDAALELALDALQDDPMRQARLLLAMSDQDSPAWSAAARALDRLPLRLDQGPGLGVPLAWESPGARLVLRRGASLWVLDPHDRHEPLELPDSQAQPRAVVWAAGRIVAIQADGKVMAWDNQGAPKKLDAAAPVSLWAASLGGEQLALGMGESDAKGLLILRRGERAEELRVSKPSALAWSPEDQRLAIATQAGELLLWDGDSAPRRLTQGLADVSALAWSPDGLQLAAAEREGRVRLFDLEGQEQGTISLEGPILELAARPLTSQLAALGPNGRVTLLQAGEQPRALYPGTEPEEGQEAQEFHLIWSPAGSSLLLDGASDDSLLVAPQEPDAEWPSGLVVPLGWSPSGQLWLIEDETEADQRLVLLPLQEAEFTEQDLEVDAVEEVEPDLYDTGAFGEDGPDPEPPPRADVPELIAECMSSDSWSLPSPDRTLLAVSEPGAGLTLWQVQPQPATALWGLPLACEAMDISADNSLLACARARAVIVIDIATHKTLSQLAVVAQDLTWSPDQHKLAVRQEDGVTMVRWDRLLGFEPLPRSIPVQTTGPLVWSPDSERLLLLPEDNNPRPHAVILEDDDGTEPMPIVLPCPADSSIRWVNDPEETLIVSEQPMCTLPTEDLRAASAADLALPVAGLDACLGPIQRQQLLGQSPWMARRSFEACAEEHGVPEDEIWPK